jgi:probable phosphoglycerate mutase
MLRLILVRHGRTSWNVEGRVQGGGRLDATGQAQATALAERLIREPITAIYSSPAMRARQTVRSVARRLGLQVIQQRLLRDLDYGRFAGWLLSDMQKKAPEVLQQWRSAPETVTFEDGENLDDLRRRITRFINEASDLHSGETVLAATHDSPVRVVASMAMELPDSQHLRGDIRTELASVTTIQVENGHIRMEVHNDVAHLRGVHGAS